MLRDLYLCILISLVIKVFAGQDFSTVDDVLG